MSSLVSSQGSRETWERAQEKQLDETAWQAWVERNRERDQQDSAARAEAVTWVAIAALVVAATLFSGLAQYDVAIRFIVAVGAIAAIPHSLRARHYFLVATFGALALLYNPVEPVFSFSGDWHRALLLVSILPFVASLSKRDAKLARDVGRAQ